MVYKTVIFVVLNVLYNEILKTKNYVQLVCMALFIVIPYFMFRTAAAMLIFVPSKQRLLIYFVINKSSSNLF